MGSLLARSIYQSTFPSERHRICDGWCDAGRVDRWQLNSWYAETEMMVLGFIGLGVLLLMFVLAQGARRFNIGPNWLRQFLIDKHTLY